MRGFDGSHANIANVKPNNGNNTKLALMSFLLKKKQNNDRRLVELLKRRSNGLLILAIFGLGVIVGLEFGDYHEQYRNEQYAIDLNVKR